ncbi:conjugal transfer protein TraI [Chitinophaga rhizosphaerae]|uniref:conjugal transfer protein TraI n=1 Tax=Chitinophaga rhizosphaerae TaxID=1864947 RepID=UPI000F813F5B|nr:conjugal transfer protein TraI [Chitinophaga rhizosphaerae]
MNKLILTIALTIGLVMVTPRPAHAEPISQVITAVIKKVLKAMDLAVQRLQNATIKLQNVQKALENLMAKLKLDEIFQWTEKQRKLFSSYYDELWKVKNAIATYKRTKAIVENQLQVLQEYKRAVKLFSGDKHFKPEQIEGMMKVYLGILNESIRNIDQITSVINSFSTQMGDARRLEIIAETDARVQKNLNDIRSFTNQNVLARIQKARDKSELATLRAYYGINQ